MNFLRLLIVSTLVLGVLCSGETSNLEDHDDFAANMTRVANGDFVNNIRTFPSFVYFPGVGCGGTLINNNIILTAGHCLYNSQQGGVEDLNNLFAVAGAINNPKSNNDNWQQRGAVRAEIHPNYDPKTSNYDIAIVETCPFTLDNDVGTIPHFVRKLQELKDNTGVVVGFGVNSEISPTNKADKKKSYPNSNRLLQAGQNIIDPEQCKQRFENYRSNNAKDQAKVRNHAQFVFPGEDTQICGLPLKSGQSQCSGDSGGPLYCETTSGVQALCGVVSSGPACGYDKVPGVYAGFYPNSIFNWIQAAKKRTACPRNSKWCRSFTNKNC